VNCSANAVAGTFTSEGNEKGDPGERGSGHTLVRHDMLSGSETGSKTASCGGRASRDRYHCFY